MNRAVPPFIYFPAFAAWDTSEPFLLLFRGSLRCNVEGFCPPGFGLTGSRRKERGGLTFASAVAMVLEITSLFLPSLHHCSRSQLCKLFAFMNNPPSPGWGVSMTPSHVRLARHYQKWKLKNKNSTSVWSG